jgi:uncharacterized protein YdhG (YjbR/CyaY superfamily)
MKETPDVEAYLAAVPEPGRTTLREVRAAIQSVVPAETTESICYRMPMFKYKGVLVGYAAFTNHCSLILANGSTVEAFKDELAAYETTKGTVKFPLDKPLPAALVKKLVKARVEENESKKRK